MKACFSLKASRCYPMARPWRPYPSCSSGGAVRAQGQLIVFLGSCPMGLLFLSLNVPYVLIFFHYYWFSVPLLRMSIQKSKCVMNIDVVLELDKLNSAALKRWKCICKTRLSRSFCAYRRPDKNVANRLIVVRHGWHVQRLDPSLAVPEREGVIKKLGRQWKVRRWRE